MRGHVDGQQAMFVAFNVEEKVPMDHPLRAIKARCDSILKKMSRDFNAAYGHTGHLGVPLPQLRDGHPPQCLDQFGDVFIHRNL